jgi:cold shock CspA family protein
VRFAGKLQTWHEDRGFGFIRPLDGGQDIFVHASGLPRPRPGPDEVLTFEVALNPQGKKKAVDVRRQAVEEAGLAADRDRGTRGGGRPHARHDRPRRARTGWRSAVIVLAVGALVAAAAYRHYEQRFAGRAWEAAPAATSAREVFPAPASRYRCDGRTQCSQMHSCEEATWFLGNCPGVQMDGNGDGVPCEKQWCRK